MLSLLSGIRLPNNYNRLADRKSPLTDAPARMLKGLVIKD